MSGFVSRLLKDKTGATAIDESLIAGLIFIDIIGAVTTVGANLSVQLAVLANALA